MQSPRTVVNIFPGRCHNTPGVTEIIRGQSAFECCVCEQCFTTQADLLGHLSVHAKNANGKCQKCEKNFTQVADLKIHLFGHSRTIILSNVEEAKDKDSGPAVLPVSSSKSSRTPATSGSSSATVANTDLSPSQESLSETCSVMSETLTAVSPSKMRTRSSPAKSKEQLLNVQSTAVSRSSPETQLRSSESAVSPKQNIDKTGSETVPESVTITEQYMTTRRRTQLSRPSGSTSTAASNVSVLSKAAPAEPGKSDAEGAIADVDSTQVGSPKKMTHGQTYTTSSESQKASSSPLKTSASSVSQKDQVKKAETAALPALQADSKNSDATQPSSFTASSRTSTRMATRRRRLSPPNDNPASTSPVPPEKRVRETELEMPSSGAPKSGDAGRFGNAPVSSENQQLFGGEQGQDSVDKPEDLKADSGELSTQEAFPAGDSRDEPKTNTLTGDTLSSASSADANSVSTLDSKETKVSVKVPFIPKYEPIQTRKRAKCPEAYSLVAPPPRRARLAKGEMLPDEGPKPKAVPKSMLILEPELLPRGYRNRGGGKAASPTKIYASSKVSGPFARSGKQLSLISSDSGVAELGTTIVLTDGTGQSQILAEAQAREGHSEGITYRIISQPNSSLNDDTPTSLLLLAEAAYPTTASEGVIPAVTTTTIRPQSRTLSALASQAASEIKVDGTQNTALSTVTVIDTTTASESTAILSSLARKAETTNVTVASEEGFSLAEHWMCTVCGEMVKQSERSQHVAQHLDDEEEEEFVCEVCGEQLRDEEDMELHMAVEHDDEGQDGDGFVEEDEGEDEFSEEGHAELDDSTTMGNNYKEPPSHTCTECGETFRLAAYLRKHVNEVHNTSLTEFGCDNCSKTFATKTELENHSRLHKTPGSRISFKCVRCAKSFLSAVDLSSHALQCPGTTTGTRGRGAGRRGRGRGRGRRRGGASSQSTRHKCSLCGKSFSSDVYLKAHLQSNCNSLLQCLYCEKDFRFIGALKEHMAGAHPDALPYRCAICQRGFSRSTNCLLHEQTHTTEKLHRCTHCGESFSLESYLKRHINYRHLKQVNCVCGTCGKEFVRRADMIKHARVHTGERPYVCEICHHGFKQQSNYKYHMMRHRGEKPHKCPVCLRGFRVPSHLKIHLLQHTDNSFPCSVCEKVFSQARYLQRHMRIHSGHHHPHLTQQQSASQRADIVMSTPTSTQGSDSAVATIAASQQSSAEQVIIEPFESFVGEQVVAQTAVSHDSVSGEPVIEFIINEENPDNINVDGKADKETATTIITATADGSITKVEGREVSTVVTEGEVTEEQAIVNADEGSSVVVGAYSEGEGGSVEEGTVTLPFRDLAQLLGGKNYKCDVCSESFGISPNSTYNMIHTGQNHILVVSLNDHMHGST